jgi:hypothetical protein
MSNNNGSWSMQLPESSTTVELGQVVTAPGHLGEVFLAQTGVVAGIGHDATWASGVFLRNDAEATALLVTDAGFAYPDANGYLKVRVLGPNAGQLAGATATISPASGSGPVYIDSTGKPDPTLTSTVVDGEVLFGNVTPGRVTITVSAPNKRCTASPGGKLTIGDWAPSGAGTIDAIVAARAITDSLHAYCF